MFVLQEVRTGVYTKKMYHVCNEQSGGTVAMFGFQHMAMEYSEWLNSQGRMTFVKSVKY